MNDEAHEEETCEYCDLTQPKSSILIHIGQNKECKAHYGPRFKEMKVLHDQEEREKLDKMAKQNVQKEFEKKAELANLAKLAQKKKKLCKLRAVLSDKLEQKAGLVQNKENVLDPLKFMKKEVSSIGCKTAIASKNLNILNLESQISVSLAMDFTEARPSEAQLENLSKLQEKRTKHYLDLVERRPVDEKATAQKSISKEGKRNNGHPMTENNDPQHSTSSGTTEQNEPRPLLSGSPQLPFISNSYYSSDSISPKNQDNLAPKECIKYFSGGIGGPITLYPEPWGTNELEFCKPVTKDFELTKEHKAIFAEEKLPLSMYKFPIEPESVFGSVLPNLKIQDFALPWSVSKRRHTI